MNSSDAEMRPHLMAACKHGSVHYCACCNRVSISYKNITLPLALKDVDSWYTLLENKYLSLSLENPSEQGIQFKFSSVFIRFTAEELDEVLELIRLARLEIQRYKLEKMFSLQDALSKT
jgi:hypothetical protein